MSSRAENQPVRLKSPFGKDLLFRRMDAFEELGRLYQYQLDMLSPNESLVLDDMLGQDVTVEVDLQDGAVRYFHGYVSQFSQTGRHGDYACYTATVHPWLWFLTQKSDCRIFQEKTVPDIIEEVFREDGFTDFKNQLSENYRTFEYCVQYRETDFNFVSRLMEQEGIYYYFEHEDGRDTLVMSDSYGAHYPLPSYSTVPYFPPTRSPRDEHIYDWHCSKSVRTGAAGMRAYHFKKPRANLEVNTTLPRPHAHESYEMFDYPGEYYERPEGDRYIKVRMEEYACDYERVRGETDARGIFPGGLFDLTDFPRDDQNREYLVTQARHSISIGNYESGGDDEEFKFTTAFEAMNSQESFRTARMTPKPFVQGPQTAIVVGKGGDEIFTDEYGRIKVQFHWDRYGEANEDSSCWVRVAQVWAGGQWGGITIPRVGQEVIVAFIEGDPDRPIVTGSVYNDENMPPYGLPSNKTQSGIKSRSTMEGNADNFNEIRFEDKMGSEEIYIHAEKDQNTIVENNQTIVVGFDKADAGDRALAVNNDDATSVGRDRSKEVGRDQFETIARNKTIEVGGGHNEQVGSSMTVMVAKNLTETVGVNYSETVGAAMELVVGAAMVVQVGGVMSQSVGGSKSESVGASKSVTIGASRNETIGADLKLQVSKDSETAVGGSSKTNAKKDYSIQAEKIQIVAKNEISLKAGSAQITMKKNGDISIKGKKIDVKGSGDIVLKGSKIKEN